jgi:hypothetical protein
MSTNSVDPRLIKGNIIDENDHHSLGADTDQEGVPATGMAMYTDCTLGNRLLFLTTTARSVLLFFLPTQTSGRATSARQKGTIF